MTNLHRGYCIHCGASVFHHRRCFICGNTVRLGEADMHVMGRRCRTKKLNKDGDPSGAGDSAVVGSPYTIGNG